MAEYLDKWKKALGETGLTVSKWVIPTEKGKKKPPPYIVIGKDLKSVQYADNKPYKVNIEIAAMLINSPDDWESEFKLSRYLWDNGINFESAEGYDRTEEVHFREYKWEVWEMYDPEISY